MSRRPVLLTAALALLAAVPAAWGAGDADTAITLRGLDTSRLPLVRATVAVARPAAADAAAPPVLTVTENGAPVGPVTVAKPDSGTAIALVVDVSQSMKGRPLARAREAAAGFVAARNDHDRIAVVGFGHTVHSGTTLTDDEARLALAVDGLRVDAVQGTALHDGIAAGIAELASDTDALRRVLVVLTDGNDRDSTLTMAQVQADAVKQQVAVYAIGIENDQFTPGPLKTLVGATGGAFHLADATDLTSVYGEVAADIASTYTLTYTSTSAGTVRLRVAVGADAVDTSYAGAAAPILERSQGIIPKSITHASWGGLLLAGAVFLLLWIGAGRIFRARPRQTLEQRLEAYSDMPRTSSRNLSTAEAGSLLKAFGHTTEKVLGGLKVWQRMAGAIERADLPLRTAELFYLQLGVGLAFAVPATLAGAPGFLTFIAMVLGYFVPFLVVSRKASKRCKAFETQLPDILVGMAASLKAGHSFNQAIDTIVREGSEPASKEFGRVANEVRLGRANHEALEQMAERMRSENFAFVVTSVNIQRQVGGSLAELLDGVADTVRNRHQFLRKVKALTATGRMSAYTLVALPFFMFAGMWALNPAFVRPLYASSEGHIILAIAVISETFGAIVLKKIVSFKV